MQWSQGNPLINEKTCSSRGHYKNWPFSDLRTHGGLKQPKGETETHKKAEMTVR